MVNKPGMCRVCGEPVELNFFERMSGETKRTLCKFCVPFEPERRRQKSEDIAEGKNSISERNRLHSLQDQLKRRRRR